jgi:ABC-type lipoprotein export system ATPase subunit
MIELQDLKPVPIYDSNAPKHSDIWATKIIFEKGKTYLITAPSGKGKSTLLHSIYGLRKDFSGDIKIEKQSTSTFDYDTWADLRQKRLSIVFQDLRLFLNLTAMENIELNNSLCEHHSESKIQEMANKLGVGSLLSKPCATLSYGQRQRIAIIRALCQPFDFLLLDEPFSHLDAENVTIARNLIQSELSRQGAGLLLVSLGEDYGFEHDASLAL